MDGYLKLENGAVFHGKRFGYEGEAFGETVFNTGMTGYLESLTDRRSSGQILCQTFPLIGNYGVIGDEIKNRASVSAYIVRQWCQVPSNFRSEGSLDIFLRENRVPGLYGIDTRALTRMLRSEGSLRGIVTSRPDVSVPEIISGTENLEQRAKPEAEPHIAAGAGNGKRAALLNLGATGSIAADLAMRGYEVTVLPADTKNPGAGFSALVISGGAGDPAGFGAVTEEIRKSAGLGIPVLAFGLGHQLLALAMGGETSKLGNGHRGANIPVADVNGSRVYITSQNHGFCVSRLPENAEISFKNAFDGSCEGLKYRDFRGVSLQFFPEGAGSPHDMGFVYDSLEN